MNYKEEFIRVLGNPDNEEMLDEYLNFILTYELNETIDTENHHILPRSEFSSFTKTKENIICMEYKDHIVAHELLASAYNIHSFTRPLNFMSPCKNKELFSLTHKKWWEKFKNTTEYEVWREIKSKQLKAMWKDDEYKNRMIELSHTVSANIKRKETVLSWYNIKENKESHRQSIIDSMTPGIKSKISKAGKNRWDNMSVTEYENICNTMKKVNTCPEKRLKNSKTIKERWKNDKEFIDRQKQLRLEQNERGNNKKIYKITFVDGSESIEKGFEDMIKKYKFNKKIVRRVLKDKKPYYSDKILTESTMNTIGIMFEEIRNETN